jgi:hypothetical protein
MDKLAESSHKKVGRLPQAEDSDASKEKREQDEEGITTGDNTVSR